MRIFGSPSRVDVLHQHDELRHVCAQVHGAAHAAGRHVGRPPVREVAARRHLHAAEHDDVEVAAARHREGSDAIEEGGAGAGCHGLALGVVVGTSVYSSSVGLRAVAEEAVLGVQVDARRDG